MVEWAHALSARIYLHAADKQWIMRNDAVIKLCRLSFMRSYPNFIPLALRTVEHIGAALEPFSFETIYGHYFDRVIASNAKAALEASVARYKAAVEGQRGYE